MTDAAWLVAADLGGVSVHHAPAHPSNFGGSVTTPRRAIVLHTPEEEVDDRETTPAWFANPDANVSMPFYVNDDETPGRVIQMVSLDDRAWGHGVLPQDRPGGFVPLWAREPQGGSSVLNYNSVALGIEIEGHAATIRTTLVLGGAQWLALVALVAYLCRRYRIPVDREHILGHDELSVRKRDPGFTSEMWAALIHDVRAWRTPAASSSDRRLLSDELAAAELNIVQARTSLNAAAAMVGAVRESLRRELGP